MLDLHNVFIFGCPVSTAYDIQQCATEFYHSPNAELPSPQGVAEAANTICSVEIQ